jgi:hypothetical protein
LRWAPVVAAGELAGFGEGGVEVEGGLEIQRHQAPLVGGAELLQGVDHRVRGGAAEAAVAGVLEQAVEPVDVGQVGLGAVAVGELVHEALQQRGADPARGAEAAALVGEEMHEGAGHLEEVAGAVEDHEGAGGGHVFVGDAALELVAGQADAGRAAHLHGLGVAGAAVFEDAGDRHAEGVFVDAGRGAVAGDGQQLGAGRLGGAGGGEGLAAAEGDEAGLGQGLDVVHHRRPPR